MGDWITVDKKTSHKQPNKTVVYNKGTFPSEEEINNKFEETYDEIIHYGMENIINDIKPHSMLLNNTYSSDITDFFYGFFDKARSLNIIEETEDNNDDYISDGEYY